MSYRRRAVVVAFTAAAALGRRGAVGVAGATPPPAAAFAVAVRRMIPSPGRGEHRSRQREHAERRDPGDRHAGTRVVRAERGRKRERDARHHEHGLEDDARDVDEAG